MRFIDLEQGHFEHIPSGAIVDLDGLGPCTGVIIHNSKIKEAYAGHFNASQYNGLEKMTKMAVRKFGKPEKLDAYVVGNSADRQCEDQRQYELRDRIYVPKILKENGIIDSRTRIKWTPLDCCAQFTFNVDTSENELIVMSLGDDLEDDITIYQGNI